MEPEHWQLLAAASRTFALSIQRLPKTVGEPLGLAYLLLRVSDYLEDNEHMSSERKVALLALWDAVLADRAPAERLPLDTASFDHVVCTLVLCSVRDPGRALAEMHRILRPGGRAVILERFEAGFFEGEAGRAPFEFAVSQSLYAALKDRYEQLQGR